MAKITICSGILRSGSTWSYNVCRIIEHSRAKGNNENFKCGFLGSENLDKFLKEHLADKNQTYVIKAHYLSKYARELIVNNTIKNICTYRDPRDALASQRIFQANTTFSNSMDRLNFALAQLDYFVANTDSLFLRYETFMQDPPITIKKIAQYLNIELEEQQLAELNKLTDMDATAKIMMDIHDTPSELLQEAEEHQLDKVTQIHENHIYSGKSGYWQDVLSADEQKTAMIMFRQWIIGFNYETESSFQERLASIK